MDSLLKNCHLAREDCIYLAIEHAFCAAVWALQKWSKATPALGCLKRLQCRPCTKVHHVEWQPCENSGGNRCDQVPRVQARRWELCFEQGQSWKGACIRLWSSQILTPWAFWEAKSQKFLPVRLAIQVIGLLSQLTFDFTGLRQFTS